MEKWQHDLDRYLTTPPEPEESQCICCSCKEPLYPDEEYYELDDEIYCEYCAEKWLEGHRNWVTDWMAFRK